MKDDEAQLWQAFGSHAKYTTPREAGKSLGIPTKRVEYLCRKWARNKIYNYGTTIDMGWKEGEQK